MLQGVVKFLIIVYDMYTTKQRKEKMKTLENSSLIPSLKASIMSYLINYYDRPFEIATKWEFESKGSHASFSNRDFQKFINVDYEEAKKAHDYVTRDLEHLAALKKQSK